MRRSSHGQAKREALSLIRKLPEDVSTQDILAELLFKQQVEAGLQDVAAGRVVTRTQLQERLSLLRVLHGARDLHELHRLEPWSFG